MSSLTVSVLIWLYIDRSCDIRSTRSKLIWAARFA